jgi:hypothetical protein
MRWLQGQKVQDSRLAGFVAAQSKRVAHETAASQCQPNREPRVALGKRKNTRALMTCYCCSGKPMYNRHTTDDRMHDLQASPNVCRLPARTQNVRTCNMNHVLYCCAPARIANTGKRTGARLLKIAAALCSALTTSSSLATVLVVEAPAWLPVAP